MSWVLAGCSEVRVLPVLQVRLLGNFQLQYAGQTIPALTSPRLQELLAYLILHRDTPISRQQLAALFWPDTSETQARTNLRNLIHQLRQSLPCFDEFIHADAQVLGWQNAASFTLDVASFEACLQVKPGHPPQRETLEQAARLYTGDLLPDCYEDWIEPTRERLHTAYLSILEALAVLTEEAREYPAALEYVGRLVAADPLHASANHRLVRLHALLGDRAGALKAYRAYSGHLSQELGAEPELEIQELVSRLQHPLKPEVGTQETLPFMGRKAEWRALLSAWQSAQAGQPQFLCISGEAGIGKTRLVEELARWAALQGIHIAIANCYPVEGNLPFAPLVNWLRAQPLPHLDKVWLAELARLLPEVRQNFSGLPRQEPQREAWERQRLFEALARALLARKQAQLLVLEDIHWCDQDTLEWLHYFFRFASGSPLLVVATTRIGEVLPEHALMRLQSALRAEGKLLELKLLPLPEFETLQLVNQVRLQSSGQSLGAEEAGEVYREAEGNPLFAIEMVRLGAVEAFTEPPWADSLAVSAKVQSVLTQRVGQVSSYNREIICLAATIGREFDLNVLREASQESEEHIIQAIDELLQRQIIREISPETAPSEEIYDFTHDLLRQAAFGGISTAHRRLLHRKVAEAYQQLDRTAHHPRHAEIASHYEHAGLPLLAVHHYHLAAETAAGMFANADAQRHLRRAITLAESSGVDRENGLSSEAFAGLLESLGDLLALDGKYSEAQSCYERTLAEKSRGTHVWKSQVYRKISETHSPRIAHALAHAALDQAEKTLGFSAESASLEERQEWLQVQLARIQVCYWEGRPELMEVTFQRVEPEVEALGRLDQKINLLSMQLMLRLRQERYRLSAGTVEIARRRLELTGKYSNPYEQAVAKFQFGFSLLWHGNISEARVWLARALEATSQVGIRIWQLRSLAYLGVVDRELGNLEDLRSEMQQIFELSSILNAHSYRGIALSNLGWLAWRNGDVEQAERLCQEANDVWQQVEMTPFVWLANWVLLDIAVSRRDFVLAARVSQAFVDPHPTNQLPIKPAADLLRTALSAWQSGDEDNALAFYNQALQAARAAREL